ncbi:hypothetical protein HAX54_028638 [Datura stramonium]|uniref:Uncharacterized protein n=1 Tax=Datura stramonium TaxID=4076 RepID=A0ABS8S9Q1_DATST|nr:hypothetical protein [Datura stramonium]
MGLMGRGYDRVESSDVLSSVPSAEVTTILGIVSLDFSSVYPGSERTFKDSVSKTIPSFRVGALTYSVED